ncbi:LCP family protein [Streptomyces sp. C10-9-1]|uniref:LCP family protein n=1 Tax=Streptomyces sp. C10-9-1 TaxID=1859285 RepID=UPI0021130C17|nr:LCP family protein [Streptomyces sp. C10-9-1]MCQ6552793.1 LCP family protein [Streptomyces sp. C10-9-1]
MSEQSSQGRGDGGPEGAIGDTGERRRHHGTARRIGLAAAWTTAAALLVAGSGLAYAYFTLQGSIDGVDIDQALGTERPKNLDDGSMDILVLGSDSRAGDNGAYGRDGGAARSDTAMVVHVHTGRTAASVVSIPRDTLVERPDCTRADGTEAPGAARAMFNTAYETGGPACAVKTVEAMSGIRMDHYLEVDFTGFTELVDALGGVEITTTEPLRDADSRLDLEPGTHTLDGEQSLALVRTRKGVGDGSDLGRIELQQAFVRAFVDQVRDVGVLGNPKRLLDLAGTAARAVTPDSGLDSVNELVGFARGLGDLGADDVSLVTLPVRYDPVDPNRVVPVEPGATEVWRALKQDRPIPGSALRDSAADRGQAAAVVAAGG